MKTRFLSAAGLLQYGFSSLSEMFFNLQSWRERFEQARTDKNVPLVRDLLDELAAAYRKVSHREASGFVTRFVTE